MSKVYVLFVFDVEDYIGSETDDGLRRLLDIFEAQGAQATWKLVGEKLRVMESRGRSDILRALAQQDVGYHTDFHSRHPTVAEVLEDREWEEGVAEFARRERPGYDDVRRVFGRVPVCYGQPGDSWAPQVFPVLREWGIPLYLDVGDHVGLVDETYWYCGILNVFRLRSNRARVVLRGPGALQEAKRKFAAIVDRLRPTGGVVEVLYHPCEFVNTTFICSVNFARGANPPPAEWRAAPLKPREEIEEGFDRFAEYLAFIQAQPDVEILTGTEFVERAPDHARTQTFTGSEIVRLAEATRDEIAWQQLGDVFLSPAEVFGLLVEALATYHDIGALPARLRARVGMLGPIAGGEASRDGDKGQALAATELLAACGRVDRALNREGHLPAWVDTGQSLLTLADFLVTVADLLVSVERGNPPESLAVRPGNFNLDRYVGGEDTWRWGVLPHDFNGDHLLKLAGLQTWTLKPAHVNYL
jgi:hypothetical protein